MFYGVICFYLCDGELGMAFSCVKIQVHNMVSVLVTKEFSLCEVCLHHFFLIHILLIVRV